MGWWGSWRRQQIGEPPDYRREGLKLANQAKYHEALTSFRKFLRLGIRIRLLAEATLMRYGACT